MLIFYILVGYILKDSATDFVCLIYVSKDSFSDSLHSFSSPSLKLLVFVFGNKFWILAYETYLWTFTVFIWHGRLLLLCSPNFIVVYVCLVWEFGNLQFFCFVLHQHHTFIYSLVHFSQTRSCTKGDVCLKSYKI